MLSLLAKQGKKNGKLFLPRKTRKFKFKSPENRVTFSTFFLKQQQKEDKIYLMSITFHIHFMITEKMCTKAAARNEMIMQRSFFLLL